MLGSYLKAFNNTPTYNVMPTKIEELDSILGGGLPYGKIVEVVGRPDVGKTNLLFDVIEELIEDKIILYIATSKNALGYLNKRRLDNKNNLIICVTNKEDDIINIIKSTIKEIDLYIIDCVPQIITNNEEESFDMKENQNLPGLLQKLTTITYGEEASVIVVNHLTYKNEQYVSRWLNMFKKYCSIRLEVVEYGKRRKKLRLLSHKLRPNLVKEV